MTLLSWKHYLFPQWKKGGKDTLRITCTALVHEGEHLEHETLVVRWKFDVIGQLQCRLVAVVTVGTAVEEEDGGHERRRVKK